ncbi:hypothetical protein RM697_03520 [Ichthyenterobacterium sp. W332]|uniref:Uncharacterized protein n=1 Tax=Microcosmobacter mediterraneus TaxID=3075607 RepID=A0ABU2YJ43_9FLAO|nr:hypothetical protein [Ichthyenterobacterium sp. W332]MDT0557699.1 hypothetical protein [Ichthyenterobacterium sp. W332]
MKNLKFSVVVVLLMTAFFSYSQDVNLDMATERGLMSKTTSPKIQAQGSPYIDENFKPVKIPSFDTKVYLGRYNAYNGEMEIKVKQDVVIALDVNSADYEVVFVNDSKTYKSFNYTTERGISKKGFLVVVNSGENANLLKAERIKYYDKVPAMSSYQQDKPAKFRKESDVYYIQMKSGSVVHLPVKKKDLLKAFPKHSKAIKTFLKENKVKLSKEEGLAKVANYIGSL